MKLLQLTLALLKPDVVKVPFVFSEIRHDILDAGFHIVCSRELCLRDGEAERFYAEHEGRFFHNRLVTFMKSGPIHAMILAHPSAIAKWRQLMGPTKTFRAQYEAPQTIRGMFGLTDTRNCSHGSDSPDSVAREIKFFFPDFNQQRWYEEEEPYMRNNQCQLDESLFIHRVSNSALNVQ
nr:EOG090X0HUX [Leptodora kindtii]